MRRGRKAVTIEINDQDKELLEKLQKRGSSKNSDARRARILLLSAEGLTNSEVGDRVGVSHQTVGRLKKRFNEVGIDCLNDLPRSGAPRKISDEAVAEIIRLTLESKPEGKTHWSTRTMAKEVGISRDRVSMIWRAFGLKPHRCETFQLSTDPFFVEKVRDVVGLYLDPPQNSLVLSVDEKSQIQALERTQPILSMRPGQCERQTSDYYRNGTTTLFAALDVATGKVYSKCQPRHTQEEFLKFLRKIDRETPSDLDIHIIADNYSSHKTKKVKEWLAKHPRWHIHFTPTHSSWLNQVERFFAKITQDSIRRGSFRSVDELKEAIDKYIEVNNSDPKPFKWTATAEHIFEKVTHLCSKLA